MNAFAARLVILVAAGGVAIAQDTRVIEGRVVDLRGDGVPAANVAAIDLETGRPLARIVADGNGVFRLPGVPAERRVEVRATADGRCEGRSPVPEDPLSRVLIDVHDAVTLHGVLRNVAGEPVPNSTVRLRPTGGVLDMQVEARTDEHGAFTLAGVPVAPVFVTAAIGADGIACTRVTATRDAEIRLQPITGETTKVEVRITGIPADRVADVRLAIHPDRPVAISQVPSSPPEWFLPPPFAEATLAPDGSWTATLPHCAYWIEPKAEGLTFSSRIGWRRARTGAGRPVTFDCTTSERAVITCRAAARGPNGEPVEGVKLLLTSRDLSLVAVTGEDGSVAFRGPLRAGKEVTIRAIDPRWAVDPEHPDSRVEYDPRLRASETLDVTTDGVTPIRLVEGCVVRGRLLLPDQSPAAGVRVELRDRLPGRDRWRGLAELAVASTDAEGRFAFRGVHDTFDELRVRVDDAAGSWLSGTVTLAEAGARVDLGDAVLRPPASVEGRVRDGAGRPAAGVRVQLHGWDPTENVHDYSISRSTITNREGRYRFVGVFPGGATVQLLDAVEEVVIEPTFPPCTVTAGKTSSIDLEYRPFGTPR